MNVNANAELTGKSRRANIVVLAARDHMSYVIMPSDESESEHTGHILQILGVITEMFSVGGLRRTRTASARLAMAATLASIN